MKVSVTYTQRVTYQVELEDVTPEQHAALLAGDNDVFEDLLIEQGWDGSEVDSSAAAIARVTDAHGCVHYVDTEG